MNYYQITSRHDTEAKNYFDIRVAECRMIWCTYMNTKPSQYVQLLHESVNTKRDGWRAQSITTIGHNVNWWWQWWRVSNKKQTSIQVTTFRQCLTPSVPTVRNCCYSKGSAPYWSNPLFWIFDIRALWRSGLSARAPECQKFKIVG